MITRHTTRGVLLAFRRRLHSLERFTEVFFANTAHSVIVSFSRYDCGCFTVSVSLDEHSFMHSEDDVGDGTSLTI
jgi:hypothetical protein